MIARAGYVFICLGWLTSQLVLKLLYPVNPLVQRYLFVICSFLVLFYPFGKATANRRPVQIFADYLFFGVSLAIGIYLFLHGDRYVNRWEFVDPVFSLDVAVTILLIGIMLELTRRIAGLALPLFTLAMLVYGLTGTIFSGIFNHPGMSLKDLAEVQLMGLQGIFGIAAGVCVDFIFYFVVFGALYEAFHGGELLTNCGLFFTRRTIGGEAKAEVVASAFMGTVSGSAVANVVSTGTFTIPMMKRAGFKPEVAAAVESASSTGGQIMPPVMGAGAFIMAETLGIPYLDVCKAAILPAILYFTAIYFFIHYYAKQRTFGISDIQVPTKDILRRLHLLIPLFVLIYFIMTNYSLGMSVIYATVFLIVIGTLTKETRPTVGHFLDSIVEGMKQSANIGVPIFICGVSIGIAIFTNIAPKATNLITSLGQDMLLASLLLGVLITILLGMGMPTAAAYVVGSLFVSQILIKFGVLPIAAHLFIFYYAVLGQVTPPVAMAAYTAAGIAGSSPVRTGMMAFFLCLPAFLIPFAFVYDHSLLFMGSIGSILYAIGKTTLGCLLLALSLSGYTYSEYNPIIKYIHRAVLLVASVLLINHLLISDLIGISLAMATVGIDFTRHIIKKRKRLG